MIKFVFRLLEQFEILYLCLNGGNEDKSVNGICGIGLKDCLKVTHWFLNVSVCRTFSNGQRYKQNVILIIEVLSHNTRNPRIQTHESDIGRCLCKKIFSEPDEKHGVINLQTRSFGPLPVSIIRLYVYTFHFMPFIEPIRSLRSLYKSVGLCNILWRCCRKPFYFKCLYIEGAFKHTVINAMHFLW